MASAVPGRSELYRCRLRTIAKSHDAGPPAHTSVRRLLLSAILPVASTLARAAAPASIRIPRVSSPPRLEDFEDMAPRGNSTQLAKVTDFIQRQPSDGKPATQRTDV